MSPPEDLLLAQAAQLLDELRERCAAPEVGDGAEELLIGGYASALALEGARRRLRAEALGLSERELSLATRERELRAHLRTLRGRIAGLAQGGAGIGAAGKDAGSVACAGRRASDDAASGAEARPSDHEAAAQRLD